MNSDLMNQLGHLGPNDLHSDSSELSAFDARTIYRCDRL